MKRSRRRKGKEEKGEEEVGGGGKEESEGLVSWVSSFMVQPCLTELRFILHSTGMTQLSSLHTERDT